MTRRAPHVALLALLGPLARLLRGGGTGGHTGGVGPPPPGSITVRTDDGVDLHVEHDGDPAAPLTVVLVHGFTARLGEFELQRETLRSRARLGAVLRLLDRGQEAQRRTA
jgi:hypothetical protein